MESKNINDFIHNSIKNSTFFQNTKYLKRDYWQKVIKKIFDDEYNEENESKINTF